MVALASSGIALDKCPHYTGFAVHTLIIHLFMMNVFIIYISKVTPTCA